MILASVGVEDGDVVDLDLEMAGVGSVPFGQEDVDVQPVEDDEEVVPVGVLEVGVHARLEYGDAAKSVQLAEVIRDDLKDSWLK